MKLKCLNFFHVAILDHAADPFHKDKKSNNSSKIPAHSADIVI